MSDFICQSCHNPHCRRTIVVRQAIDVALSSARTQWFSHAPGPNLDRGLKKRKFGRGGRRKRQRRLRALHTLTFRVLGNKQASCSHI